MIGIWWVANQLAVKFWEPYGTLFSDKPTWQIETSLVQRVCFPNFNLQYISHIFRNVYTIYKLFIQWIWVTCTMATVTIGWWCHRGSRRSRGVPEEYHWICWICWEPCEDGAHWACHLDCDQSWALMGKSNGLYVSRAQRWDVPFQSFSVFVCKYLCAPIASDPSCPIFFVTGGGHWFVRVPAKRWVWKWRCSIGYTGTLAEPWEAGRIICALPHVIA